MMFAGNKGPDYRTDRWGRPVVSPYVYRAFAEHQVKMFGSMGSEMQVAYRIATRMLELKIPCPPPEGTETPSHAAPRPQAEDAGGEKAEGESAGCC